MAEALKEVTARVNPRSTGRTDDQAYHKTTTELSLAQEAAELQRCASLGIQTQHVFPVQFLAYDQSTNTLSTRKVQGKELFHTLWNPTYWLGWLRGKRLDNPQLLFDRIEELGTWLQRYHQSSVEPQVDGNAAMWLKASFEEKLDSLHQERVLKNEFVREVKHRFVEPLDALPDTDYQVRNHIQTCQVHGDFIIYNILVDSDYNAHVLDFSDTRRASNIEDLARMYSSLWAISQTNATRKRLYTPLLSKFLTAYGVEESITHTEFFRCNLAYNFIVHLSGQQVMKGLVSWNSMRELNQISQAGIKWIKREL